MWSRKNIRNRTEEAVISSSGRCGVEQGWWGAAVAGGGRGAKVEENGHGSLDSRWMLVDRGL